MIFLIVAIQIVLFAGFIWSATNYFKKQTDQKKDLRQQAIQTLGLVQILNAFYCDFFSSPQPLQQYIAMFFYFVSVAYFYWTYSTVKKTQLNFAFSKSQPQNIIRQGPYKRLRHPFYFSYICAWIATFFATNYSVIAGIAGLSLATLYIKAALQEEAEFLQTLTGPYQDYKASTSRIIPFIY